MIPFTEDEIELLCDRVAERMIRQLFGGKMPPALTPREYELVIELGKAKTNPEISRNLEIPLSTLTNRIWRLAKRLNVNRQALQLFGAMLNIQIRQHMPPGFLPGLEPARETRN